MIMNIPIVSFIPDRNSASSPRSKKGLRQRSVVEPVIGHLENEGHLGSNHLKGTFGDTLNVLLIAAGYNLCPYSNG